MSTTTCQPCTSSTTGTMSLLRRGRDWLDARGKTGWFVAIALTALVAWPVGLALLAYMIWSNRMFSPLKRSPVAPLTRSSGNSAFDAYRADMLRRLQDEQDSFDAFMERLRHAKDKAEFERFMQERATKAEQNEA